LLDDDELARLLAALDSLSRACRNGEFRPVATDEDVHTALERGVLERAGSLGGKLQAGRSRNDQVATDLRLYLRDHVRLIVSRLPLGPEAVAAEVGFDGAAANSMHAVSDRDFAAELCFAAALRGVHLSRLGEEIVLWSSQEFGWVEIDDAYATGSSIMPQKKT